MICMTAAWRGAIIGALFATALFIFALITIYWQRRSRPNASE